MLLNILKIQKKVKRINLIQNTMQRKMISNTNSNIILKLLNRQLKKQQMLQIKLPNDYQWINLFYYALITPILPNIKQRQDILINPYFRNLTQTNYHFQFLLVLFAINILLSSLLFFIIKIVMNINIKIKPSNQTNGIIMSKYQLSEREQQKKNQLYANRIPQSDKPKPQKRSETQMKKKISQNNKIVKVNQKKVPKIEAQQYKKFEKQLNQNINDLNTNQASLGMIYTSNQILKQQNQILHSNQTALNQLLQHKKKTQQTLNNPSKPKNQEQERIRQQQLMRQVTGSVNKQLQQIKKVRDQILKMAKQVTNSLNQMKNTGIKPTIPNNFLEMNKNLKNMVQTSQHNIDLLSPEKFDLINKLQNFNIDGYTHHMNQLKNQIALIQKQSEQVQKQLRQRVNKLQKIAINPKFQEQLLQPYQKNIKTILSSINLPECRKRVYDKIGEFDYSKFELQTNNIMLDVKNQMNQVQLNIQKYKINVPEFKFDKKQMQILDVKLPSILQQYKAERGIVLGAKLPKKQLEIKSRQFSSQANRTGPSIPSPGKLLKQTSKPQTLEGLITKPKDYSSSVKYKRVDEQGFKTVFNEKNVQKQRKQKQKQLEQDKKDKDIKKKTRQEQDFEKYLQNRANEQLQEIYKQKKERLLKMKNELYQQSKDDEPIFKLTLDKKNRVEIEKKQQIRKNNINRLRQQNKIQQTKLQQEQSNNNFKNIGQKLFQSRQKIQIKQIGKQILKQKIKNIFSQQQKNQPIPEQKIPQYHHQSNQNPVHNFAQGFLAVINNTFAQMNRGLITNIQKKIKQKQHRQYQQIQQKQIPIPKLEQIPKPPIFRMNFQQNIKGNIGQPINYMPRQMTNNQQQAGLLTFNNNFYQKQPIIYQQKIQKNDYKHLEVELSLDNSSFYEHSNIDISKSDIDSNLSKSDNRSGISRSDNRSGISRRGSQLG